MTENLERPRGENINILVTGATGFAGTSVTRELVKQGCKVYAIARDDQKLRRLLGSDDADGVCILKGDLLVSADLENLKNQLENMVGNLDVVVHTVGGGPLTSNRAFAPSISDLNYKTTRNLVSILEGSQKLRSLRLFLYFSSLAAMGIPKASGDRILYNETSACNPVLPYEQAKFETESYLKELANQHRFKTVVLRLPQIYGGPDDALMQMVKLIQRGVFPVVRGRIGSLPLINIRDVVNATCAVIRNVDKIQESYDVHLLSEGSYSYNQLVDLVRTKYGRGGMLKIPYSLLYLAISMMEAVFWLVGKPEPLNRRRLISLTKDRIVDSSKFMNAFEFKFEENVRSFIAGQPS